MKTDEIKKCVLCDKGVMHSGSPLFWRIKLQRMGVDSRAVNQVSGMETMIGSVALARVMGPDPDIAIKIDEEVDVIVCERCAGEPHSVYELGLSE